MTKTPRWLRSVLSAAEEKTPHLSYERENRPALDLRRDTNNEPAPFAQAQG
ncbi:MAG: hypothetical protein AAGA38_03250 [Pseudomonadota bacterium]